ncbi:MAG: hypothetical protein HY812_15625 [Planctomycetes bacterium]|nr:hypothetical protein [Planctomycetota bacterium]
MFSLTLWAGLAAAAAAPGEDQPWNVQKDLAAEAKERASAAGKDPAQLVEFARWCQARGLFESAEKVLSGLCDGGEQSAAAAGFLGLAESDQGRAPEELLRFRPEGPPASGAAVSAPAGRERDELLKGRFRDVKLVNKSTYFDLWTDLSPEELVPYTKLLNDYYRSFKGRFRAYEPASIDVLLFASRSDYLIDYVLRFEKSGEHILGYYVPEQHRLVFYDEAHDRDEVMHTARHECTHLLLDVAYHGAALPLWMHEGIACFMAAGGREARGRATAGLVLTLMAELEKNRSFSLEQLMDLGREQLKYEHYAWSWSLVHYLNGPDHQKRFSDFLLELRYEVKAGMEEKEVRACVRSVFSRVFAEDLDVMGVGWTTWFAHEFRLERPDQFLAMGYEALDRSRGGESRREKETNLEIAQQSFAGVPSGTDAALEAERRFGELECAVERAALGDPDMKTCRLLLRAVQDGLSALPELEDESRRSILVRRVLEVAAEAAGIRRPPGAFDLREALMRRASKASASEAEQLRAIVVLGDDLLEVAFASQARVLERSPVDRRAATEWLHLAMCFAPARLPEIFDTLRLLVELDPEDRSLAALGAAYGGLGRMKWGQRLVEEACRWSARPGALAPFRKYVGLPD